MNINVTLFLQIINFLITYYFLNKLLFKPVINFIKNKKFEENSVLSSIEDYEHVLLELQEEKHDNLSKFQKKIKKEYGTRKIKEPFIPELSRIDLDPIQVDSTLKKVKSILVEKVPNVD